MSCRQANEWVHRPRVNVRKLLLISIHAKIVLAQIERWIEDHTRSQEEGVVVAWVANC